MKKTTSIFFLLLVITTQAQVNFVPNPGFEEYNNCPILGPGGYLDTSVSSFYNVKGWFSVSNSLPVYHNTCATHPWFSVPKNSGGFQYPHNGNGYLRIGALQDNYGDSIPSSYSSIKLYAPLTADSIYKISFWVSLVEFSIEDTARRNRTNCTATSSLGVYFSNTKIYYPTNRTIPLTPQVENDPGRFLDDTSGWMEVSGLYQANGGEQFITIGNFKGKKETPMKVVRYGLKDTLVNLINYYLDDVSLTGYGMVQHTRKDTALCEGFVFTAGKRDGYVSAVWNDGDTSQQRVLSQPGTYWVTSTNGNVHVRDTFVITRSPAPEITSLQDTTVCFDDIAQILLDAGHFKSYLWKPTGETTQTIYSSTAQLYSLTVTDTNNCSSTKQVAVLETCPGVIYIPNAFTPNHDGVNDVFLPRTKSLATYELRIINRWGAIIFTTGNPSQGWDGKDAPADTYIAELRYSTAGKSVKTVSQNVTLLR